MNPSELSKRLGQTKNYEGFPIGPLTRVIGKRIAYSSFTANSAKGYYDIVETLPVGSRVTWVLVNVTTAFTGDTTGTVEVGTSSDNDRFSPATDASVYTAGVNVLIPDNVADAGDGNPSVEAETTVRVTITGSSAWTNVTAGSMDVYVMYEHIPFEAAA